MTRKSGIHGDLLGYLEHLRMSGAGYVSKAVVTSHDGTGLLREEASTVDDSVIAISDPTLGSIREELAHCQRCRLGATRTRLVFGAGNPNARLVFVGEAPGRDEDLEGEPFVGRAGRLLTKIIEAIGLVRDDVYICNVVKCRPPENRNPLPEEIEACEPFLLKQLQAIGPAVICALGKFAAHTLLKTDAPISTMRGNVHDYHGIPLIPTYHPAYLLRNPKMKREVWHDVQLVKKLLEANQPKSLHK